MMVSSNTRTDGGGNTLRSQLLRAYHTTKIVVRKRVQRFDVPPVPHFDEQSTAFFTQALKGVENYLEYGSGGSTLLAHRRVSFLVSVESDRKFLRAVHEKLRQQHRGADTTLMPVYIGITEQWGKPVFTKPTARRLDRWRRYVQSPWYLFRHKHREPDLILVDGRFRVACVLESLMSLSDDNPCRILLDDYASRWEYRPVEEFADLLEMQGRMAVLRKKPTFDRKRCEQVLQRHYADYR